jgi:hypothetical protein
MNVTVLVRKDNTLYELSDSSTEEKSNGKGEGLFIGMTKQYDGATRRALIQFDFTELYIQLANVSEYMVLNDCWLHMIATESTGSFDSNITIYESLRDFGEGESLAENNEGDGAPAVPPDATWNYNFFQTSEWNQPGGDFDVRKMLAYRQVHARLSEGTQIVWNSFALTNAFNYVVSRRESEINLLLKDYEEKEAGNSKKFYSVQAIHKPYVILQFIEGEPSPPPPPPEPTPTPISPPPPPSSHSSSPIFIALLTILVIVAVLIAVYKLYMKYKVQIVSFIQSKLSKDEEEKRELIEKQ